MEGNSGPYLQYTYARCQSVLKKKSLKPKTQIQKWNDQELALLREFYKFEEKIIEAAERFSPAVLAEYLLILARKYNEFYAKNRIIGEKEEEQRLFLTERTSNILKTGLEILGIETIEKM
jgi:arginyl-tRNA synthetase